MSNHCYHCGLDAPRSGALYFDDKIFCCKGCQTVYEIFALNGLSSYYDLERMPGAIPQANAGKYDFLDNEKIVEGLLEFDEGQTQIVSLHVPHIHCSACIWILENLRKLQPDIVSSQVNFHQKSVRINYNSDNISLKQVVQLLAAIGYEPYISLDDYKSSKSQADYRLTYKLGIAFFCFGNIMLLSFPEYFEHREFWLDQYKGFFRWLIFALALPSFFYSASGYYVAAYNSIRAGLLNIEIPIALGIIVMFVRSVTDLILDRGPGFFDSMAGLVFFMLLGKMFQQKTYKFLNFERDFKSYFPIAVTRLNGGHEENIPVYDVAKGDRLLVRNMEIIPADGILMSASASIDYSFVTGEAIPVSKHSGDKLFAGGRQVGPALEMEVLETVSQSYLTQLWGNAAFQKENKNSYRNITDTVSRYFTPVLLLIAVVGFAFWSFLDMNIAFNVFTAVLIVACPCALALTAPFTLGNVLRIFGATKFYLKDTVAIEQMARVDTVVFDKTGTITTNSNASIAFDGEAMDTEQLAWVKNAIRASNHPLSRMLYDFLPQCEPMAVDQFDELTGNGISAMVGGHQILVGSAALANCDQTETIMQTAVHIAIDGRHVGKYIFHNRYRDGMATLFQSLGERCDIIVLSGDNEGERGILQSMLPPDATLVFNKKPDEKLAFIKELQRQGRKVMMVGDGLNDAGALMQSDIGVAISENVNVFSPACDAILDAGQFTKLHRFLQMSHKAIFVIKMSFALSLLYNVVGLAFAVTGNLLPIVAAIIMPLSTFTIIGFVTVASNFYARRLKIFRSGRKHDGRHILSTGAKLILTPEIAS